MSRFRSLRLDARHQALFLAAALVGIATGLVVAGFDAFTRNFLFDRVARWPLWAQAVAPAVGLTGAALTLRYLTQRASPATTELYIENFHEPEARLPARQLPGKLIASASTLGFGGAMGYEGPSVYAGAAIGSMAQHRLSRFFRREDSKALLVAGAAAGLAAIFKAPATGVLYAVEVPFQDDVARRGLVPALIASAASYLVFVSIIGTKPLFGFTTTSGGFNLQDLVGALLVGLLAGLGARLFAASVRGADRLRKHLPVWQAVLIGGGLMAGLALLSHHLYGHTLSIGAGYDTVGWVLRPTYGVGLVAALFLIRFASTTFTVGGGGAGGMFIPLVVQGSLLGGFVAAAYESIGIHTAGHTPAAATSLFVVLGIASFLGAGYRTPLAGVMFVAETTGKALYVVPALIAAAVSQLVMGKESVSEAQHAVRRGYLERRFRLPISTVLDTDVLTVPPDATLAEFVGTHVVGHRRRSVPVVDRDRYLGMCRLEEVSSVPRAAWESTKVEDVMRTDIPVGSPGWKVVDAMNALEKADVDSLAVTSPTGAFVGVVASSEIVNLDEILRETGRGER